MKAFVLAMVISVGFLSLSILAIRKRRLRDQAALLWIGVSLVMVCLSLALPFTVLTSVSHSVGIAYPSDLILVLAVVFLVGLVFQLSLHVAALKANQTVLVQEVALLRAAQDPQAAVPPRSDAFGAGGAGGAGDGGDGGDTPTPARLSPQT